jgi:hypothetical protein
MLPQLRYDPSAFDPRPIRLAEEVACNLPWRTYMQLRRTLVLLLLTFLTAPAFAEVVIERSADRIFAEHRAPRADKLAAGGLFGRSDAKGGAPPTVVWLIPWVIDDSGPLANATLFSLRNDNFDGTDAGVDIDYYDRFFDFVKGDSLSLSAIELLPVSVRAVGGLVAVPGAVNRGLVRIETDGNLATDYFQVDFGENFASGDRGLLEADLCDFWRVRFLRFPGTTGGTVLSFVLNGPLGLAPAAPTIVGEVYDQSGAFINSFTVRTNLWVTEIEALDLVVGETEFGTILIELDTEFSPGGLVLEKHSAFSKFSVGLAGSCSDIPF